MIIAAPLIERGTGTRASGRQRIGTSSGTRVGRRCSATRSSGSFPSQMMARRRHGRRAAPRPGPPCRGARARRRSDGHRSAVRRARPVRGSRWAPSLLSSLLPGSFLIAVAFRRSHTHRGATRPATPPRSATSPASGDAPGPDEQLSIGAVRCQSLHRVHPLSRQRLRYAGVVRSMGAVGASWSTRSSTWNAASHASGGPVQRRRRAGSGWCRSRRARRRPCWRVHRAAGARLPSPPDRHDPGLGLRSARRAVSPVGRIGSSVSRTCIPLAADNNPRPRISRRGDDDGVIDGHAGPNYHGFRRVASSCA